MGPHAGLRLQELILANTKAGTDQEHLPVLHYCEPGAISDRTAYLLGKVPHNPAGPISAMLRKMEASGVTVAGIACNTSHAPPIFKPVLDKLQEQGSRLRLLNMVEETVSFIGEVHPEARRIAVFGTEGTYRSGVYQRSLTRAGYEVVPIGEQVQRHLIHRCIYDPAFGIKAFPDPISREASNMIEQAFGYFDRCGAEVVILACTELSWAIRQPHYKLPAVDACQALARALIRESFPEKLRLCTRQLPEMST
jgi:aspartate racemase